ncbi:MAG: hypothetical protein ABI205_04725 [Gemmatimonadaceae bacterium]
MYMKLGRTIVAGIVGGAMVLAVIGGVGRLGGSHADLCALTGVIVTGRTDSIGWLTGCAAQLTVAVIAALVYAAIFEWVTRRAGAMVGAAIAVPHVTLAGLAVGFLPVSRVIAAGRTPPGFFLEALGPVMVLTFVCAHLLFGTGVGLVYGQTHEQRSTRPG